MDYRLCQAEVSCGLPHGIANNALAQCIYGPEATGLDIAKTLGRQRSLLKRIASDHVFKE
jgi:hypothetical protein